MTIPILLIRFEYFSHSLLIQVFDIILKRWLFLLFLRFLLICHMLFLLILKIDMILLKFLFCVCVLLWLMYCLVLIWWGGWCRVLLAWLVHVVGYFDIESLLPTEHPSMLKNLVEGEPLVGVLFQNLSDQVFSVVANVELDCLIFDDIHAFFMIIFSREWSFAMQKLKK